ncbi:UNVERIFIED_CONTAM: hypothetical protein Sradi_1942300 [Sesamum radiatum]|uniref:Uncharacterized protein n=1 Tax=Sesamum radiatum TaxID=300843 RepID=A0AAW2TDI0_SESRA
MDSHCLALRQQLKEKVRARLRKETGPGAAVAGGRDNAAPADNYGSFFGPSEIVFADRVNQETKFWLENFERGRKFKNGRKKSTEASKIAGAVLQETDRRKKLQCLKDSRDYSFLSSDCEIPVPGEKPNKSPPPEKIQGVQTIKKNPQNRQGFSFSSSYCEIPMPGKKPNINSRRPEKIQGVQAIKKPSETGMKNSRPEKDSQVSRDSKKPSEKKKKSPISKKPHWETPPSKADGRKRKLYQPQADQEEEEVNAISIIREMFGYDPQSFMMMKRIWTWRLLLMIFRRKKGAVRRSQRKRTIKNS